MRRGLAGSGIGIAALAVGGALHAAPDVITSRLAQFVNFGDDGTYRAYSIGADFCNTGTENAGWDIATTDHPVFGQNLYRYHEGRFEQIGLSWLRHGVCPLQTPCGDCQPAGGGCPTALGPGCFNTHSASANGSQSMLSSRLEVDPTNGTFVYPSSNPPYEGSTVRRLRARLEDVRGLDNPGGRYFIEMQVMQPEEAPALGGVSNNASYREVTVNDLGSIVGFVGDTVPEMPAIDAWPAIDPDAAVEIVTIPLQGTLRVGHRAASNGDGTWRYDYAVHNMDADRAIGGFAVPIADGVTVTDVGFHDVEYHPGDPQDGVDWSWTQAGGAIRWSTEDARANPSANALRWGTTYSFRFTADAPPGAVAARFEFFEPGSDADPVVGVRGPAPCPADLDGQGAVGFGDLTALLAVWGPCGGCVADLDGGGAVGFEDLTALLAAWGPC